MALPRGPRIGLALMFVFCVLGPVALGAIDTGAMRCVRDGERVDCEYVEALFGLERGRSQFADVTGARLDLSAGRKGGATYRTVLLTRAGELPLSSAFTYARERNEALIDRLTQFLGGSERTMELSQVGWGWELFVGMMSFWLVLAVLLPRLNARTAQAATALVLALCCHSLCWHSKARAQACSEELRILQALQQQIRAEILAGNVKEALALEAKRNLQAPAGYDFENETACQKWAIEVANAHRASCSFERARAQLDGIKTEQPHAIDRIRTARERFTRSANVPFTCKDRKNLYLLCEPTSDTASDAWCARAVEGDQQLEIPRSAWCKLVDERGAEVSTVGDGYQPTCREDVRADEQAQRARVRAERRASVATSGTGIALLSAMAIPVTFIPLGVAKLLRRLGALDRDKVERMEHRSYRARKRVLPLLGVTALSVSSLSSRFWWAGLLTAGCGVTADVMLAQHWHDHDKTRRAIGITTATLGATAGLLLNLETMGWTDAAPRRAFLPTLSIGVAQAEVGVAGRF